jgi:long-chain acyl-CoA synthetase
MTNAIDTFWRHADNQGERIALREGDRSWRYAQLRDWIAAYARKLLAAKVRPGDRVLLVAPTSAEFVVAYHGLMATGAIAVTVNSMSTQGELEYFIEDAGCSLVIGWHESAPVAAAAAKRFAIPFWTLDADALAGAAVETDFQPVPVADDDIAVLLYTSGTTGRPKGAELMHGNLIACSGAFIQALNMSVDDCMGTALPLFHVFGQAAVMGTAFRSGASLSLLRPFSGESLLHMAASHGVTILAGVPTMWNAMLHADVALTRDDFSKLRLATSGGATLPFEVAKAFNDRFGCMVMDGYGLSETTGAATFNVPGGLRKDASVGPALPGLEVAIVDSDGNAVAPGEVGEVAIKGPVVMRGYWQRPDASAEARRGEWFLSGDLGKQDEDGYVWIVDRKKDLVIRGGYNVYPREIEEALYAHPSIREAAVIGVPDARLGEEIAAVMVLHPGENLEAVDLRGWLEEQLSAYKVPRVYQFVDELPRGATGKILKRALDRVAVLEHGTRVKRARTG